jgi:hypothetical protein
MIGRGLLIDPFLPGDIKGLHLFEEDRSLTIEKYLTDLYLVYRKRMNDRLQAISVMKELWGFLSYSFVEPEKVFSRIKKCKSFENYEKAVADVLKQHSWLGSKARFYAQS